MAVLITGGAGFIGSHTCVELMKNGEKIIVMDNYYNSTPAALDRVCQLTERGFKFYEADMLDMPAVDRIFDENEIETVIHLAGYKGVEESVKKPLVYYSNNLRGTFNILETMKKYGCTKFIFSSPISTGDSLLSGDNPYHSTNLIIENLCREMYNADNSWTMLLLRSADRDALPKALVDVVKKAHDLSGVCQTIEIR